ncbi:MAG: FecR domain-containing protein [Pseudomonadota bacterium]
MSESDLDIVLRRGMHAEPLPQAALVRIRVASEAEWRASTGQPVRRHRWPRYAAAATIAMLMLGGGWIIGTRHQPGALVGHFEHIDYPGAVEQHRWLHDRALADGEEVHSGQRILVRGGGRIALASAGSLRLAPGANIQIDSAEQVRLTDGDLYVDIPPARSASVHLAIVTPAGTFTHLGTQFQLAVHEGATQLRVREGQVRWSSADHEVLSGPGTQLSIDRDGHAVREQTGTTGADWAWAEVLGAPFEIENRSLADYLHYVARETGRALLFTSPEEERRASTTILHGSIQRLNAVESLSAVMATTSLRFTLGSDSIRIESSADSGKALR